VTRTDVDVCVVGAGFAGLTAALRLRQAGLEVAVLEASDRLGGRVFTEYLPDGTPIERGGAWLGPGQDRAYALVAELGGTTYPTWAGGEHVLAVDGVVGRYRGTTPSMIGVFQLVNLGIGIARLDRMAKRVPLDAPWTAAQAARWDSITLEAWLARNVLPGSGRRLLSQVLADVFTSDPAEVSLLQALFLIHSHQDFTHLTSIEGGAQQDRVAGGLGALLARMEERLGSAVHLRSPVHAIAQSQDGVDVAATELSVRARRVVVAVPAAVSARITYDPPLPLDRALLMRRMPLGAIYKIALLYDAPWWRDEGFSGQSLDVDSSLPLTLDACGPTGSPGIVNLFGSGRSARRLSGLAADERRRIAVAALTQRFGPRAADAIGYVEQDWAATPWIEGGMVSRLGPGVLTEFGPALREPVGRVHWAGTETATITFGGIDGAIRSGERAAAEVIAAAQTVGSRSGR
jgi:monoamine oxidase